MSQKNGVKTILVSLIADGLVGGELTKTAAVQIAAGLQNGTIPHKKGQLDERAAYKYAGALISNYMKKDLDLNGGVAYVPENPRGPQVKDELLKTLTASLKSLEANKITGDLVERTREAIAARKEAVNAEKGVSKVIPLDEAMAILAAAGIAI